jgi:hypothetical protein
MRRDVAGIVFLTVICAGLARGSELIANGGFETGNLSGWTLTSQAGSFPGSGFFVTGGSAAPASGEVTAGPSSGAYYAVSDGLGPAAEILSQAFTVPGPASSVILSFSLFVNTYGGTEINPLGLD